MFVNTVSRVLSNLSSILTTAKIGKRTKVTALAAAVAFAMAAFWIQPTFASSAQPEPAAYSLSNIANYIWSFFSGNDARRVPLPSPVKDGNYTGQRPSGEIQSAAIPCTPTGVTLNVPAAYPTIQAAIIAANPSGGDTISVAAGTYVEQISINKCVTIVGAGVGSTTIQAPATLAVSSIPLASVRSIVEVRSNSYVTMTDLTIAGPVTFAPPAKTFGVFVGEAATLNMRRTRVTGIHKSSGIDGVQDGQGIVAGSVPANTIGTLDFDNVQVDDYQKNGIIVVNAGSNAILNNTTVNGMGPTTLIAQNGLQVGDGATATVTNSHFNDNNYTPQTWAAAGILPVEAAPISISNCTFNNNSYAIYEFDSTIPAVPAAFSVTGSTFTNNSGAGIIYFAAANPMITDNTISGSNGGILGFVTDNQTSTIARNSITQAVGANSAAIYIDDYSTGTPTTLATVNAHFNRISSDSTGGLVGLQNDSESAVNAENNWWGCNAGPGGTGCDTVAGTGAGLVDYSPWLTLSGITPSDSTLEYSETSTISGVNLCTNSDLSNVCTLTDHLPNGLTVGYNTSPGTNGSVSPASAVTTSTGVDAATTFTATLGPIVGNQIENAGATFDNQTITTPITIHDSTPPTVTSLTADGPTLTNAASVTFTAVFSEPVNAVVGDFQPVMGGGVSGATVASVIGGGTNTLTITVNTGSGSGTLGLEIPSGSAIADTAGNIITGVPATSSTNYTIDKDAPTGTLAQASGQPDPTSASPVNFTVTFTDAHSMSALNASAVTVAMGAGTAFNSATPVITVTGSNPYNVAVSGMDQPGQVTVTVGAGAVTDAAGNPSADVVEGDNSVYYTSGASTLIVDTDGAASDANFPASCSDSTPTAYTTIQAAINAASAGNTIKVCPGIYEELVDVTKAVTLLGPNAGINPNSTPPVDAASAIIRIPDTTTPDPTFSGPVIVDINAQNVKIDGFTVDGDNPAVTSGIILNGADVDAGIGVQSEGVSDPRLTISNTFVRNIGELAIYLSGNNATNAQTSTVSNNKIENVPGAGFYGGGIYAGDNAWANITGNSISHVRLGIVVENMSRESANSSPTVSNNVILTRGMGIRPNLAYTFTQTQLSITGNTVSSYVDSSAGTYAVTDWRGIRIESWNAGVPLTVSGNTIRPDKAALQTAGYTRIDGIWLTNTYSTSDLISITGNTISNALRGISDTIPGTPTVTCNAIYGNDVGVYVGHDVQYGGTSESYATGGISMSNNSIVGNGLGVQNDQSAGLPPDPSGPTTIPPTNVDGNYWGSADGPGPIDTGLGDGRSTSTSLTGFLTAPNACAPVIAYPTVTIEQASGQNDPTNAGPVHFTVQFSEPVTGFSASHVRLSGSAGATTATVVSGSGAGPYDVEVSGMTGDGTIIADLYAGAGQDSNGIPSVASTSTDNTVTYDATAPTVVSIVRVGSTPTNVASVQYTVTFSEPVQNVDPGDFSVATTGTITGASVSTVTGSGTSYTVTVSTGTGDGNIGLNIPSGSDIADSATNMLSNLPFTSGEQYTIDKTGPTPSVAPDTDPDTTSPVDFTVNFNEPVTGFDAADVSINGSANPTAKTVTGGPSSYTVHVTGMSASGPVTVSINNTGVADALGNVGTGTFASSAQFNLVSTPNVQTPTAATWAYFDDVNNTVIPGYDYVYGPTGGPLPAGSARLLSGPGELKGLFTQDYNGKKLANITTLSYSTYVNGAATNEPTLQFNVDYDLDDADESYQGRVVYVPSQNGTVSADTWQNWNALTGVFWYSSLSPFASECTQGTPCTLNQMLALHPNMGIHRGQYGAIGFRSEPNSNSNVDNFVIGINSANTVVNFEPAGTIVSTPTAANGWFYWEDDDDHLVAGHDYVFGPAGGPLPVGSARVASGTTAGDKKKGLFTFQYRGTRLDQITTLKYSTYAPSTPLPIDGQAPSLQIGVDFTGGANPTYQGRLVFVPSGVVSNTWQTWDLMDPNTKFYYSSETYSPSGDGCKFSEGSGCTLAYILGLHPNLRVMPIADPGHPDPNNTWGVVGFRTDPGKTGNVDNLIVGVNSANTVFNFEPAGTVVSTPVSPEGWFSWDDTDDVLCDSEYVSGPAGGPLPVGSARIASSTCNTTGQPTSDRKGFFTKAFQGARLDAITTLSYSTFVPTSAGTNVPTLQIGVDFTGMANPSYQGRLVYVPSGVSNDTWQTWNLDLSTARFYYSSNTYSPSGDGCKFGEGSGCTLATILAAHPNARIMPNDDADPGNPDTWGVLGFRTEANANANVDNLIVGVNGAVTTFDFEAAPPTVSISDASATEGSDVQFTVSLTGDTAARTTPVKVLVSTSDGTATGGTDYTPVANQVVTFAPNETSKTVNVTTATDNVAESAETFTATLSNAVNAGIGTGTATGTINDAGGYIAIGGHVMAYNNGGSQTGIAGVTMTLTGTGPANGTTKITDSNGYYNFDTDLSTTGEYTVTPSCPSGPCMAYTWDPQAIFWINPASNITNGDFLGYNADNPRTITISNVSQTNVGDNITVPVIMQAQGTETSINFDLLYDDTKLQYLSASGPSGSTLTVGPGTGSPRSILLDKSSGTYSGPVQIDVTFSATPGTALSTPVSFGSSGRDVSNFQGISVPAVWINGLVTFAQGHEGDITNGTLGGGGFTDGQVKSSDVSRMRQLVVGSVSVNPNVNEFQRADVSPYNTRGNGCISATDLTGIRLYSVGSLPLTPAAGPSSRTCRAIEKELTSKAVRGGPVTSFSVLGSRAAPGTTTTVEVEMEALGTENALGFTLNYDTSIFDWTSTVVSPGSGMPAAGNLTINPQPGKVGVVIDMPVNQTIPAGTRIILSVTLSVRSNAPTGLTPVTFTSELAIQDVSGTSAETLPATWEDGVVEIMLNPTASPVSVGGRVHTVDGRAIQNTVVTLTATDGRVFRAMTNQFGYYQIDGVPAGGTYVLKAVSKQYVFDPKVIAVGDNITDADITPRE